MCYGAVSNCRNLTNITLPSTLTVIEHSLFRGDTALVTQTLPENIKTIRQYAFYGCTSLANITIPARVEKIEQLAFNSCSALTEITIEAETPPVLDDINAIPNNVEMIFIPDGTLTAYQTATNWSNFADKFVES